MLEKIITPHEFDVPDVNVILPSEAFGTKCASQNENICHGGPCTVKQANDGLKNFIRDLKPDPRYLYLHIIALGSGEYFGANTNGDFFPEEGLIRKHNTFCTHAKHYKHHVNKNPKISYGHPVFSTYNEPMRRVELILATDREKAPDLVQAAENGKRLAYSMACKIPWDRCSICGNKAKVKRDYCSHIKNQLLEILPDGRQVYMINPDPTFFDISYVLRPADKTAMMLSKVAGCGLEAKKKNTVSIDKKGVDKKSAIKKEIDVLVTPILSKEKQEEFKKYAMPMLMEREPELPIDDIAHHSLKDILSTLTTCGIICKPQEFDRIMIIKKRKDPKVKVVISPDSFNDDIYSAIKDIVPERSCYSSHIASRLNKMANEYTVRGTGTKKPSRARDVLMGAGIAAAGYTAYKKNLGEKFMPSLKNFITKHPRKAFVLFGLGALALRSAPLLGPRPVSDSLLKYHTNLPTDIREGIIVDGYKRASHVSSVEAITEQAMQPFGSMYIDSCLAA